MRVLSSGSRGDGCRGSYAKDSGNQILPQTVRRQLYGRSRHAESRIDTGQYLGEDHSVAGRVERAVRAAITPGDILATPSGRGQFTIARYTTDSLVLLLGEKEAWTPLPWRAMEEIPDFLRGRDCVLIGSLYSTDSHQGSLDEHLKGT